MLDRVHLKTKAKSLMERHFGKVLIIAVLLTLVSANGDSIHVDFSFNNYSTNYINGVQITSNHPLMWYLPIQGFFVLLITFLIAIILAPIQTILVNYYRDMLAGNDAPDIFRVISNGSFWKISGIIIITRIIIALGYMVFVVPGIYLSLRWRYVGLIAIDHPDYTFSEILAESYEMTNGYKLDLFILDLSFIGWAIVVALLGVVSFGLLGLIGGIILRAYMAIADMAAYLQLISQNNNGY